MRLSFIGGMAEAYASAGETTFVVQDGKFHGQEVQQRGETTFVAEDEKFSGQEVKRRGETTFVAQGGMLSEQEVKQRGKTTVVMQGGMLGGQKVKESGQRRELHTARKTKVDEGVNSGETELGQRKSNTGISLVNDFTSDTEVYGERANFSKAELRQQDADVVRTTEAAGTEYGDRILIVSAEPGKSEDCLRGQMMLPQCEVIVGNPESYCGRMIELVGVDIEQIAPGKAVDGACWKSVKLL